MPAKPQWLLRLPEIIEEFSTLSAPVVDRSVLERVFQVRRRRAIELMHYFGGYQSGRTFLIDRTALVRELEALLYSPEFHWEHRRKERFVEELDKARRYAAAARVSVPVQPEIFDTKLANLPEGVHLQAGELKVVFSTPEELLEKLFAVAQALANDFERFRRLDV